MLNTDNWANYPFTVEGINFVSKIDPKGEFYPQVEKIPAPIFARYNEEAIQELIGNPALLSKEELDEELSRINEGATQALICLA